MGAGTNENVFGFDVSPPDQGLGVGTSSAGTAIVESLNLTIQAFTPSGAPLTVPIGANTFMGLGPCTGTGFPTNCPSDPRVYWDPQTKHWFLTDFTFTVSPAAPAAHRGQPDHERARQLHDLLDPHREFDNRPHRLPVLR